MTDTVANYLPAAFPAPSAGHIAVADGTVVSNWTANTGWDCWDGVSAEFASVRTLGGVKYWYGDGFGSLSGGLAYPIWSVIDRITQNGVTTDLAAKYGRPKGTCSLPYNLPDAGTIIIEQWFYIYPTPQAVVPDRPGYWRAEWSFGYNIANAGWQGNPPTTRRCMLLREVWWDPVAGWVRGLPVTPGALPWVNDKPVECPVVPHEFNYYAKDRGPLWTGTENGTALHLKNVEYDPPKDKPMPVTIVLSDSAANELRSQLCDHTPPGPTGPTGGTGSTGGTGGGGGGTGTPPPSIPNTVNFALPWVSPTRIICNFNCDDNVCIYFRTPAGPYSSISIGMAEYAAQPCQRYAVISTIPGDFNGGLGVPPYNASSGVSLSWNAQIGGSQQPYIVLLNPNTDYYINLRNTDRFGTRSCVLGTNTSMFCDLNFQT